MKHNNHSQGQHLQHVEKPAEAPSFGARPSLIGPPPSHGDVEKRAYFSYVNSGSTPGHCERNWLAAESALIAEQNVARAQGL